MRKVWISKNHLGNYDIGEGDNIIGVMTSREDALAFKHYVNSEQSLWFAIDHVGRVKYTTDSTRAKGWVKSGKYKLVRGYRADPTT